MTARWRSAPGVPKGDGHGRAGLSIGDYMSTHRFLTVALSVLVSTACFHRDPAVEVSTKDATLNTRWHANLASPASLAAR